MTDHSLANNDSLAPPRPTLAVAPLATLRAKRVCIIKPSSLGDVVQSLPVIRAVRQRFACASLSWIINDSLAPLVEPIGVVDEIIRFERDAYRGFAHATGRRILRFFQQLRERRFDVAIDLQGLFRSAAMSWATDAPVRIGLASAREGATLSYTHLANDLPLEQNAVDRYWSVARMLGVGHLPKDGSLALSQEELTGAQQYISALQAPVIAVHPGARWETKRWPARRFAEAIQSALDTRGGSVIIVGGSGDEQLAEEIKPFMDRPVVDLVGKTSLRQLAAVLKLSQLLVTNDSGPLHVAAAVGTPTVTIFTCTAPVRAGAQGGEHRILQTNVSCRASYLKNCANMTCMKELRAERLLPILNDALDALPNVNDASRRAA